MNVWIVVFYGKCLDHGTPKEISSKGVEYLSMYIINV